MISNIKPTSDIFFKYLLGSERNKSLLLSFLNAVQVDSEFKLITSVEIKNPFNLKKYPIDKESILDIKATDENGRQYDVEMQASGDAAFKNRSLYYWAKLYASQLEEGDVYSRLNPTICINVLDFILFKELDTVHTCFLPIEKDHTKFVLTDHLLLHFLEIPKLENKLKRDKLNKWLSFFKNEGQKEDIVKILIKDDEDIAKAHAEYQRFTQDEEMLALHESRQKWKHDYNSSMALAEEKGIEKGEILDKQNVLVLLITQKFGIKGDEKKFIRSITDKVKLDSAIKNILESKSTEDILSHLR